MPIHRNPFHLVFVSAFIMGQMVVSATAKAQSRFPFRFDLEQTKEVPREREKETNERLLTWEQELRELYKRDREQLRQQEKKSQENRNSQIERTLVSILSSYQDEQPPSNQDVTAFARAVLIEFMADKYAEKGAVDASDDVLSLLEDQKNATKVRANVHRWLQADAALKRVFASRDAVAALQIAYEAGGHALTIYLMPKDARLRRNSRSLKPLLICSH